MSVDQRRIRAAKEVSKHRVDQAPRATCAQRLRALHRMVYDRMRRDAGVLQLIQGNDQQRLEARIVEGLAQQMAQAPTQFAQVAQCTVSSVLEGCALPNTEPRERRVSQNRGKAPAAKHTHQGFGGPRLNGDQSVPRLDPVQHSDGRHRQQPLYALLGRRMGAKEPFEAAARERIDDHHLGGFRMVLSRGQQ
jgi:hypothetical protein